MENKTEHTKKQYVAMLDIMGFKAMVEKNNPSKIYTLFNKIYDESSRQHAFKQLDITIFSDTIIIVSHDDSMGCYEDIVFSSAHFANLFIKNGYAINGVIAFGDVTHDKEKNICFGMPIIDAHILQEDLFFYGIVLHESANKKRLEYTGTPFLHQNVVDMIINLKVPIKSKGMEEYYCVNWCESFYFRNACFKDQIEPIKKCIRNIYKKNRKSGKGMFYIMNTEMVLKEWYDRTARDNKEIGWGDLISEEVETRCPEVNNNDKRCDLSYKKE